jgi:phosphohistidine phosphatase
MDLILWRHADAEDGADDMRRALTDLGHKQAKKVGKWLDAHLPADTRILVSPAVRAQETAQGLGRKYVTQDELAPGADAVDVMHVSGWPEAKGTVLIIGHQPTLGRLTSMLLFGAEQEFTIKKGGLVWLTNRVRRDERQVVLKAALYPELLA